MNIHRNNNKEERKREGRKIISLHVPFYVSNVNNFRKMFFVFCLFVRLDSFFTIMTRVKLQHLLQKVRGHESRLKRI